MKRRLLPRRRDPALRQLLHVMAVLRSPEGCPWDREQNHRTLRFHAVEEVYELLDAIEAGDDAEMREELGDLLLQVVFHCQLAGERKVFDFESVAQNLVDKLVRRHPHVFGDVTVQNVDQVWANWEQIKRVEKMGTRHERPSVFDGIPRKLPGLLRAEKLVKKARKAGFPETTPSPAPRRWTRATLARELFSLAATAQGLGWSAEELLRAEIGRRERELRRRERKAAGTKARKAAKP